MVPALLTALVFTQYTVKIDTGIESFRIRDHEIAVSALFS
jgi:hypothetical protein